jgi:hypothetical protein
VASIRIAEGTRRVDHFSHVVISPTRFHVGAENHPPGGGPNRGSADCARIDDPPTADDDVVLEVRVAADDDLLVDVRERRVPPGRIGLRREHLLVVTR